MAETVARANADECALRPQDPQELTRDGPRAPVMTDLQHVDLLNGAVLSQGPEHPVFCIACQQRREPACLHLRDDAGFVCRRVLNRGAWPDYGESHATDAEHVASANLTNVALTGEFTRLCDRRRLRARRSCGDADHSRGHEPVQRSKPTVVILMQVGDDDGVDRPQSASSERTSHCRRARSGVNQHCVPAVSDENRVTLTDVKHLEDGPAPRRRSHR